MQPRKFLKPMALNEYNRYRLKDLAEWYEITDQEAAAMAEYFEQAGRDFYREKIGNVWLMTYGHFQKIYDWMKQTGRFDHGI